MADWRKVMFSDESTFRLVRGGYKLVRWPQGVSRYASKYTIKTVKHPESVMVWGAFSGNKGRGGLYFLPKNVTMRGDNYLRVLDQHNYAAILGHSSMQPLYAGWCSSP